MPSYIDIARWVQDSVDTTTITTTTTTAASLPPARYRHKRVLAEMDANADRNTPKKRRALNKQDDNVLLIPADEDEENVDVDVNVTPRPLQQPPPLLHSQLPISRTNLSLVDSAPNFPPRRPDDRSNKRSMADDATSSTSARSSKASRRLASPQKEAAARAFALYPVAQGTLAVLGEDTPQDVLDLVDKMEGVRDNRRILPKSQDNPEWRRALQTRKPQHDAHVLRTIFKDVDVAGEPAPDRQHLARLVCKAEQHRVRGASEAAWNSAVHHPLLEASLVDSRFDADFRFENITTATISPLALPPSVFSAGGDARKVDFCLAFDIPPDLKAVLVERQVHLNQTEYTPVEFDAIAFSIETKSSTTASSDEGLRQLSIWAQAQVIRLRQLLDAYGRKDGGVVEIPVLLLLLVQGHEWTLVCFKDRAGRGRAGGTFYSGGITFGSTSGLLEACKIVEGLRLLTKWAEEVWWPWVKEEIVERIRQGVSQGQGEEGSVFE
ncbi:unnamed protein product [Zymoseptoria tritici ST99CH_3D1]|nr:unnamed protein product [Zymoseptoria tritici ST99CH_3D1]